MHSHCCGRKSRRTDAEKRAYSVGGGYDEVAVQEVEEKKRRLAVSAKAVLRFGA